MAGRTKRLLLVPMVLVLLLVAAAPASAIQVITKHGNCSLGWSTYSVEFKNDFGRRLEVDAFVNATEPNRPWHVNMRHNGVLFLSEVVYTNSLGNLLVEAHHPAKPLLPDTLTFKAFNRVTGEVCTATATLR